MISIALVWCAFLAAGADAPPSPAGPPAPAATPADVTPSQASALKVKALYLTGWTAGGAARLQHYIELANTTEINAYVIDVKDSDGYVGYKSNLPDVVAMKAWLHKYDADKVLAALHANGIRAIGRIACFKDPVASSKQPAWAITQTDGTSWKDAEGLTWLNPYRTEAWPYLIAIAKEAVGKGFDEIQFDYIRFANDGPKRGMDFTKETRTKSEIIDEFLAYARRELPHAVLSADVFGIICESEGDTEDIGQHLETIGHDMEYLSPMVYPSHYALGQVVNKTAFPKPDLEPYKVIYNTLLRAKERLAAVPGGQVRLRPYLQDFTAAWLRKGCYQAYGADQAREQIKAVYDAGFEEWIFWDARNTYSEDAFLKEGGAPDPPAPVSAAAPSSSAPPPA